MLATRWLRVWSTCNEGTDGAQVATDTLGILRARVRHIAELSFDRQGWWPRLTVTRC